MNEDISIILKINGKEPDKTTADAITAITYIDNDDEHADDLQIITTDNSAFAKGDRITLQIVAEKWRGSNKPVALSCGEFAIDEIEDCGAKDITAIKAAAITAESAIRQNERCQAWEQVNLKQVADEIGERNGVNVVMATDYNPIFTRREQLYKSDVRFLADLCREVGLSLKFTSNALVIYSRYEYGNKEAVRTFERGKEGIKTDKIRQASNDTGYGKCIIRYKSPNTKELIEYAYIHSDSGKTMQIIRRAASTEEAKRTALYAIKEKNCGEYTGVIECEGDITLSTGNVVMIQGYGAPDGKYIITKTIHSIRGNIYDTKIFIEKILEGYE